MFFIACLVPDRCNLPFDSGPCQANFYRYFFNSDTNNCAIFVYGGCRGNNNNFDTPEQCRNTCNANGYNFTLYLDLDFDGEQNNFPRL